MGSTVKSVTAPKAEVEAREPVSAFVICCDEEEHIGPCLESLSFCDEVVVIDSFSRDRTVEISQALGATVIQRDWPGYKAQKAFGLASTNYEWVINLDADERISPELRESILEVLRKEHLKKLEGEAESENDVAAYWVSRVVFFLGRWWRKGGWYPEHRIRFFKKSKVVWGGKDPHEKPIVHGRTMRLPGEIQHFTYKSISDQIERLHSHSSVSSAEDFALNKPWTLSLLIIHPIMRSFKFYVLKGGYKEGMAGFIVAVLEGVYTFMKYAKLWELRYNREQDKGLTEGQ